MKRMKQAVQTQIKVILTCVVCGVLTACNTMSQTDCLYTDWTMRGEMDGAQGLPTAQFQEYRDACFKHSVMLASAEQQEYEQGLDRGYQVFCIRDNGYLHGFQGKRNFDICPQGRRLSFNSAYRAGLIMRDAENNFKQYESEIRAKRYEIQRLQNQIEEANQKAYAEGTTESQRNEYLNKASSYQKRINELLLNIQPLYGQEAQARSRCIDIANQHRNEGYPYIEACN